MTDHTDPAACNFDNDVEGGFCSTHTEMPALCDDAARSLRTPDPSGDGPSSMPAVRG